MLRLSPICVASNSEGLAQRALVPTKGQRRQVYWVATTRKGPDASPNGELRLRQQQILCSVYAIRFHSCRLQTDVTGSSDRQCKRPGHTRKLRDQRRQNPPWPANMMTRGDSTQRPAQKLRDAFPPRPGP